MITVYYTLEGKPLDPWAYAEYGLLEKDCEVDLDENEFSTIKSSDDLAEYIFNKEKLEDKYQYAYQLQLTIISIEGFDLDDRIEELENQISELEDALDLLKSIKELIN